ncbi:MAG: hypothetical protein ACUVWP_07795 [bacterium]
MGDNGITYQRLFIPYYSNLREVGMPQIPQLVVMLDTLKRVRHQYTMLIILLKN